jgi:hypothetical protein
VLPLPQPASVAAVTARIPIVLLRILVVPLLSTPRSPP